MSPRMFVAGRSLVAGIGAIMLLGSQPALAAEVDSTDIAELREQIARLKAEQAARIAAIEQETATQIGAIEAALDSVEGKPVGTSAALARERTDPPVAAGAQSGRPAVEDRLDLSGDFRLRYEENFSDSDARNRGRGVVRARLRASYALNDWLTVGGQVATGDPDDPNSADVSISNFDDDLAISLDQAYARATFGDLQLWGGKFANPFIRTDLVWDGDVNPQGAAAIYTLSGGSGLEARLAGLYFLVDESVAGPNSDMVGAQVALAGQFGADWKAELAASYYDYSLRSVAGADAGDFRSNLIGPDGRYLSDFDLVDGLAALTYSGLDTRWPVRISGNYVHNLGAATSADSGYGLDFLVGRASKLGDIRFGYGYSVAETDAVLAAFSHDNTNIATNYRQHALTLDYVAFENIILNATLYHYRPYDSLEAGTNEPNDWLDRLRINALINF